MNEQEKSRMFRLLERIARALENLAPAKRDMRPDAVSARVLSAYKGVLDKLAEKDRGETDRTRYEGPVKQLRATPEELQAAIERATHNVASGVIWRDPCRKEAMEITTPTEGSD